jgi:GTP-binding protein HflX
MPAAAGVGGPDRVTGKAPAAAAAAGSRMPELPNGRDRALLVEVDFGAGEPEARLAELKDLAASAGAEVADIVTARRARPDPALFAGRGKVDEIAARRAATDADLVIFDHALSGAQQRNLERALQCRVVDRVSLILDIFAQRAQSAEGKLQVELAQLQHLSTRLVRGWTHLERQAGGIGLRGPGETQLETDRRLIGTRVKMLKSRLARIASQRETQRRARRRAAVGNVAVFGYTKCGQVDPVQPADRCDELHGRPAVRDPRHDAAPAGSPRRRNRRTVGHRRLRARSAARPDPRVSRDLEGSRGRRLAAARRR